MLDLFFGAGALTVGVASVLLARWSEHRRHARHSRTYRLDFPRDVEAGNVTAFFASLAGLSTSRLLGGPAVTLEISGTAAGVTHHLIVPEHCAAFVTAQLRAALPAVRLTPDDGHRPGTFVLGRELRLTSRRRAVRTDRIDLATRALLSTLQPLGDGECLLVQWSLTADAPRRPVPVAPNLPRSHHPVVPAVVDPYWLDTAEDRRALSAKQAEPLFWAVGRIGVSALSPGRAKALLRRTAGAWEGNTAPGVRLAVRVLPARWIARRLERRALPLLHWPALMSAGELSAVTGLPVGGPLLAGVRLGSARQLPPAPEIPSAGTVIAQADFPGAERPLAIGPVERLRHLWMCAPTGAGKSTLLTSIAAQDMAGEGAVIVFDSKGDDLIDNVLARVPKHRAKDVIVLDPADTERPVGFNLLDHRTADRELVVENVVGIFRNLYGTTGPTSGGWGARSEDILRAALLTLTLRKGVTLTEVPRLLSDEPWRRRYFLSHVDEPVALARFWQWAEHTSKGEWLSAVAPLNNKLRAFLGRERIRLILGQADGHLDFDRVLSEGRILLVSLAKGLLGDASGLLGALILARLWQAVTRRAGLPASQRPPASILLDEFQDYVYLPTPTPDLLAQARGLGVGVTLAHQNLYQLPSEIRHAVLANCRSKLVFQLSAEDARTVVREFAPHLTAEDLQGLGPYEAAAIIAAGSAVAPPVTGVTLPLGAPISDPAALRMASRRTWGQDGTAVEAAIRRRQGEPAKTEPVGRKRRAS
jgi:hypothetical protein